MIVKEVMIGDVLPVTMFVGYLAYLKFKLNGVLLPQPFLKNARYLEKLSQTFECAPFEVVFLPESTEQWNFQRSTGQRDDRKSEQRTTAVKLRTIGIYTRHCQYLVVQWFPSAAAVHL